MPVNRMTRTCRECPKAIGNNNKSGLCRTHNQERRSARARARKEQIADEHRAGTSEATLLERYGIGIEHLRAIIREVELSKTPPATRYRLSDVIAHTSDVFGISIDDINGPGRFRAFARPRQCIAFIARQICSHVTYPQIAEALGGRDHSTIVHGAAEGEKIFATDPDFRTRVLAVIARMEPIAFRERRKPAPVAKPKLKPGPKPGSKRRPVEDWSEDWDEITALSQAVASHYAAGRDCLEVY